MERNKSAMKRDRQSQARRGRNRRNLSQLRTQVKKLRTAIDAGDAETASKLLRETVADIDKAAKKGVVQRQMRAYEDDGFPHDHGFHAAFLLVRRHTEAIRKLGKLWWRQVYIHTVRDQLSFDYCLWKLSVPITDIPIRKGSHDAGPYHKRLKHRKVR